MKKYFFVLLIGVLIGLYLRPENIRQGDQKVGAAKRKGDVFPPEDGERMVLIDKVLDGDTVNFFYLIPASGRLHGINAPEKNTEEGKKSKEFLESRIGKNQLMTIRLHGREKFGRLLITILDGEENINSTLIEKGFAKYWDGKGKRP